MKLDIIRLKIAKINASDLALICVDRCRAREDTPPTGATGKLFTATPFRSFIIASHHRDPDSPPSETESPYAGVSCAHASHSDTERGFACSSPGWHVPQAPSDAHGLIPQCGACFHKRAEQENSFTLEQRSRRRIWTRTALDRHGITMLSSDCTYTIRHRGPYGKRVWAGRDRPVSQGTIPCLGGSCPLSRWLQVNSSSRLISRAGEECVSAPTEMRSTPVAATSGIRSRVMPPDASSRAG